MKTAIDPLAVQTDRDISRLRLKDNDIVLLKGEWDHMSIQYLLSSIHEKELNVLLVNTQDNQTLDKMPIGQFHDLLKEVERRLYDSDSEEHF